MSADAEKSLSAFSALFETYRCKVCNQALMGHVTYAGKTFWCENHFTCARCNRVLHENFVPFDKRPFCVTCCRSARPKCRHCRQNLLYKQKYRQLGDVFWHEKCFLCSSCRRQIVELGEIPREIDVDKKFTWQNDRLFCTKCCPPSKETPPKTVDKVSKKKR